LNFGAKDCRIFDFEQLIFCSSSEQRVDALWLLIMITLGSGIGDLEHLLQEIKLPFRMKEGVRLV
jgi:hypothetical protein